MAGLPTLLVASATASAESNDIMAILGIDWRLLIFQIIAFLLLVFALGKWVFPIFFKIVEKRELLIEESTRAAHDAEKIAKDAEAKTERLLERARKDAADIVATAKERADALALETDKKAKDQAERLVMAAHEDISKEVEKARQVLRNDVVDLVADATEKVTSQQMTGPIDKKVIESAIKEAA